MKFLFKLAILVILILFFGWVYVMYLYLHKENKRELEKFGEDLKAEGQGLVSLVKSEVSQIAENVKKDTKKIDKILSARQEEVENFILKLKKEYFDIRDIASKFKNVSERTLRRDLQKLEELGVLAKEGSTKDVRYRKVA